MSIHQTLFKTKTECQACWHYINAFNPSTVEVEAGGSLGIIGRPTQWIQEQPEPCVCWRSNLAHVQEQQVL